MTTYLFSIPVKFSTEPHPLGAGPDDLIEVQADTELEARQKVIAAIGRDTWCDVYKPTDPGVRWFHGARIHFQQATSDGIDDEALLAEIEKRRQDPEFMDRLNRIASEEAPILNRLDPELGPVKIGCRRCGTSFDPLTEDHATVCDPR